jgi:TrmH family RNA methyltransferase
VEILEIYAAAEARKHLGPLALAAPVVGVSDAVFAKISARENPDGILCVAKIPTVCLPEKLPENSLIVVAEGLEKPGNLGGILRSMEAAGCSLLILAESQIDPWNSNAIRASQGAIFSIPIVSCSGEEALRYLRGKGVTVVATTPAAEKSHWEAPLFGSLAVVAGNEHGGLSDFWLANADLKIRIPMFGGTSDSLNVGIATALVLYEIRRRDYSAAKNSSVPGP